MKLGVSEFNLRRIDSLIGKLEVSRRNEVLALLVECIQRLPEISKKVLALSYYENWELSDIANALGLTEYQVDQMRATALDALRTMLAARLREGSFALE
jgi:RNA polymerase sigma factor (sigma-70 family)